MASKRHLTAPRGWALASNGLSFLAGRPSRRNTGDYHPQKATPTSGEHWIVNIMYLENAAKCVPMNMGPKPLKISKTTKLLYQSCSATGAILHQTEIEPVTIEFYRLYLWCCRKAARKTPKNEPSLEPPNSRLHDPKSCTGRFQLLRLKTLLFLLGYHEPMSRTYSQISVDWGCGDLEPVPDCS